MIGESTVIVNKGLQPRTTYSLYDSDTSSITNDHTIGQSGFNVEVNHYHGLGEQYFMRSLKPSVSHCNAAHDISLLLHQSLHF